MRLMRWSSSISNSSKPGKPRDAMAPPKTQARRQTDSAPEAGPPEPWLLNVPFAHRGLHDAKHPENTLAAFEEACRSGYGIELDLQQLADGNVIVVHDDDFQTSEKHKTPWKELTMADLKSLGLRHGGRKIPTFAEALEVIAGRSPVLVEIKNRGNPGPFEEAVLEMLLRYGGDYAVMSFNPKVLGWFHRRAPWIPRGQVSSSLVEEKLPPYQKFLLRRLLFNFLSKPDFIAYRLGDLPYAFVAVARLAGKPVLAWTITSAVEADQSRKWTDNFIFEGFRP